MRYRFFTMVLTSLFASAVLAVEPATQNSPATQPVVTRISLDLDKVTPAEAINKLAAAANLQFKWQGGRSTGQITIHAKDQPLLDVIANLCTQGHCYPQQNYGPGDMFFRGSPHAPLGAYHPTDTSLILVESLHCQNRIDLANSLGSAESCNIEAVLLFDPAARVASVRGLDIDRVQAEDGTFYPNTSNNWYQQISRMDPIAAWPLNAQINVPARLGKKMTVFGVIRAFTLTDFTNLTIDSPRSAGKSFGDEELKCTVNKTLDEQSISLTISGSLVTAYGADHLAEMLRRGTVTALDENDLPVDLRCDPSWPGSNVQLTLRPPNRASWKDSGPASVTIRVPRAAHQIEIPVEMRDLPVR